MDERQCIISEDIDLYMCKHILDVDSIISLAKTCKSFLRVALSKEILIKIVSECLEKTEIEVSKYRPYGSIRENMQELKDDPSIFNELVKNAALPKFFYSSIPMHLTCTNLSFPSIEIPYGDCFLTGGKVCQTVYEKEWKSDVDIWMKGQDHWDSYNVDDDFDIIFKNFEPYRCISGFDLSICMQGIEIKDGKRAEHITPLGLFTYYTKKIVATLSSQTIEYRPNNVYDYHNNPFICYLIHRTFSNIGLKHKENFSLCKHCRSSIVYDKMIIWLNRLQKYQDRFPDYEILFVPA